MVWAGRILTWLFIIAGSMRLGMAVLVALADENQEQLGRYLGIASPSGEDIDKGFMWIATGVAFGLLVRIARKRD